MRMRAGAGVFLAVVSCSGSDGQGVATPGGADGEPLGASAVAALGVTEETKGEAAEAERVTRSVTALVAVCVRALIDREPATRGTVGFHFRAEDPAAVRTSGDLASLPVAACIGGAIAKVVSADAKGTIDYVLTFDGTRARGRTPEGSLDVRHVLVDWSSTDSVPPAAAASDLEGVQRQLEFCAFGAEPHFTGSYFATIRVGGGFSSLAIPPGMDGTEAGECMTRALRSVKFAHLGTDYAIGLVATPSRAQHDAAQTGKDAPEARRRREAPAADQIRPAPTRPPPGLRVPPQPPQPPRPPPLNPKGPQVKLGPASNLSGTSAEAVQRAVVERRESIRACYSRGLEEDPRLTGTLVAEFEVLTNGTLNNFKVGSELGTQTAVCVGNVLSLMTVEMQGASFAVRYPMEFFIGTTPPGELPIATDTLQRKAVADATLVDLQTQLGTRDLEFLRIPGSGEPGLVLRAGENVLGAYFSTAGVAKAPEVCQSNTTGRVLVVRGRACASVLKRILD